MLAIVNHKSMSYEWELPFDDFKPHLSVIIVVYDELRFETSNATVFERSKLEHGALWNNVEFILHCSAQCL